MPQPQPRRLPAGATELSIDVTWDGKPVDPSERALVRLRTRGEDLEVMIEAPFYNDPPPCSLPGATDGLWQFEVVELFLAPLSVDPVVAGTEVQTRAPYIELEVGPNGHFLLLELSAPRQRVRMARDLDFDVEIEGGRFLARVLLRSDWLPSWPWVANAFSIHGEGDDRRYLAASSLPGAVPDFHQVASFPPLVFQGSPTHLGGDASEAL